MMKRVLRFLGVMAAVALVLAIRSPVTEAHDHIANHLSWPGMNPVYDDNEKPVPVNAHDVTFLVRPIRVDVDEQAPGPHEQRAVRLHVRSMRRANAEDTIAWERPFFPSDQAMLAFRRRLEPLMSSPIVSLRVRVIEDKESPPWNRRWRATDLPYWAEVPIY